MAGLDDIGSGIQGLLGSIANIPGQLANIPASLLGYSPTGGGLMGLLNPQATPQQQQAAQAKLDAAPTVAPQSQAAAAPSNILTNLFGGTGPGGFAPASAATQQNGGGFLGNIGHNITQNLQDPFNQAIFMAGVQGMQPSPTKAGAYANLASGFATGMQNAQSQQIQRALAAGQISHMQLEQLGQLQGLVDKGVIPPSVIQDQLTKLGITVPRAQSQGQGAPSAQGASVPGQAGSSGGAPGGITSAPLPAPPGAQAPNYGPQSAAQPAGAPSAPNANVAGAAAVPPIGTQMPDGRYLTRDAAEFMQNYGVPYAQARMYADNPEAFKAFLATRQPTPEQKNAATPAVADEAVRKTQGEELAKASAKPVAEAIERGSNAPNVIRSLDTLMTLANTPEGRNITSGPMAETALQAKALWNNWFPGTFNDVAPGQSIDKLNAVLASSSVHELTNRGTQFDFKTFMANNPGLQQSPEGRAMTADILRQMAQQDQEIGERLMAAGPDAVKDYGKIKKGVYDQMPIQVHVGGQTIDSAKARLPGYQTNSPAAIAGAAGSGNVSGAPAPNKTQTGVIWSVK